MKKKKTKVVSKKIITAKKSKVKSAPKAVVSKIKEKISIVYHYDVISLSTNKNSIVDEIYFEYTGTLNIPRSLSDKCKEGLFSVGGTIKVTEQESPVCTKSYDQLTKKEVIDYITKYIRPNYQVGMQGVIYKKLLPDYKIITKLPW